ncbi:hypothetical protein [uncultured Chryseobacterium sp.]|jgi:hypothetical protein|uniref:hypothetical protein n=1 Tax=uncultured Chryseobacterium sp. TaxID=259322 RepID=UPI00261FACCA|nr:hypothetical protein [uncultured Chryseobacterium sp.]
MKFNRIIFFLSLIILFNCKIEKKVNILKLAELSNYKITETHINDSVIKINGDNKNYLLEGNINAHDKSKQGWWKIKNKVSDEEYRIEYIFLDEQIANQIKIHKKGKFYKKASKFYDTSFDKNGFNFNFHFPSSKFDSKLVTFDYSISDTIKKKIIKEEKLECQKNGDYYSCFIPVNKNESIVGIVTKFSEFKQKDSVLFNAERMFIKTLKN